MPKSGLFGYIVQQIGKIKVACIDEFHVIAAFQLQTPETVEPLENSLPLARRKAKGHLLPDSRRTLEPKPPDRSERIRCIHPG